MGVDLVKDARRLEAAYDDAAGVTRAFNRNILSVVNRELEADFDRDAFEHVACWDARHEWVRLALRASRAQVIRVGALGLRVRFEEGEELESEISAKCRREPFSREMQRAGFAPAGWWTDPDGDFALSLRRR